MKNLAQDTKNWIDEHPIEAVEIYCHLAKNLHLSKLWDISSFTEYRKLVNLIYDKYSNEIFNYLVEHPEKMK